jgi:DNA processing protein
MSVSRRTLSLALALSPGIGGKSLARVLSRNDMMGRSPDEFLALGPDCLREEYRLTAKAATAWCAGRADHLTEARELESRLTPLGVHWVTAADAHYPRRIEAFDPEPPGVLFLYGNLKLLEADTFCCLCSRQAGREASAEIEKVTEELVLRGQVLVSGHDTPEYQRSAVVPLRFGAPRILVIDRGLFRVLGPALDQEPFRSARLWRYRFDPLTDLVVSRQNPDADYHRNGNRLRDRLIGGLAMRTHIVEARSGGNAETLARLALIAGRPVTFSPQFPQPLLESLGARPFDPLA